MSEAELERRAAQLRLPVGLLLAVDAMMRGEKLELRELKAKDIPEIRWLLAEGRPCTDIAMRYAVAVSAVRDVKNGKTWRKIRRKRAPKGLRGPLPRSSRRPKLTPEEVRQMSARFAEGVGATAVAREFGVSDTHATRIRDRKVWKHVE